MMKPCERAIWCHVYAIAMAAEMHRVSQRGGTPRASSAVEAAWAAVEELRNARPQVVNDFGDDSDVTLMYDEVTT